MCTKAIAHLPETFPVTSHTDFVGEGSIFVAIKGFERDGAQFIVKAIEKGATTVIVSKETIIPDDAAKLIEDRCVVVQRVDDPRQELALLSAVFADFPALKLKIIGITGTKGKTTTAFLLNEMLKAAGHRTAMMSSLYNEIDGGTFPTQFTTPQADYLHQFLKVCVDEQVDYVVMEVAAQAVTMHRTYGITFDAVIFTNLSQEHGEFYASMNDYYTAKVRLCDQLKNGGYFLVNADDEWGKKTLISHASDKTINLVSFGMVSTDVAVKGVQILESKTRLSGEIIGLSHAFSFECPVLLGTYNIYNVLAAASCALVLNISPLTIEHALKTCPPIPGRLERYFLPNGAICIIDYAHNPSSYKELLSTLRSLTSQLIVVFGCGGSRDAARRPIMGALAAQYADEIILTSDNPRAEDPNSIIADIESGIPLEDRSKVYKIVDRKEAIEYAYKKSREGSICALLGKGPDEYQIVGSIKSYFSEVDIIGSFK